MDLIQKRRSVRKYLPGRRIPREDLLKCIEAARLAPSACNSQPWKFIIVDEPELMQKVTGEIFSGIYSMNKFAREASALIVAVAEKGKFLSIAGGQIRNTRYYLVDMGIACEHLILQAAELGIGSCWIGWFDEKKLKKLLAIPKSKKIDVVISLGYPENDQLVPKARKALNDIHAFNSYSQ